MKVIGIDEIVSPRRVFSVRGATSACARGGLTLYDHVTLTVFGAAMLFGIHVMPGPFAHRGDTSFIEPAIVSDDPQWKASLSGLRGLVNDMRRGANHELAGELSGLAKQTVASVNARNQDVGGWAKALASEVSELDD
jgi:hypothetical protein